MRLCSALSGAVHHASVRSSGPEEQKETQRSQKGRLAGRGQAGRVRAGSILRCKDPETQNKRQKQQETWPRSPSRWTNIWIVCVFSRRSWPGLKSVLLPQGDRHTEAVETRGAPKGTAVCPSAHSGDHSLPFTTREPPSQSPRGQPQAPEPGSLQKTKRSSTRCQAPDGPLLEKTSKCPQLLSSRPAPASCRPPLPLGLRETRADLGRSGANDISSSSPVSWEKWHLLLPARQGPCTVTLSLCSPHRPLTGT